MKKYCIYISKILFVGILFIGTISCDKWLDIRPMTEIEADVAFDREDGFKNALTGIYIKLGKANLYGREMSFGLVDGLAGQFNKIGQSTPYFSTINYNYGEEQFINKSDNMFADAYNAIVNLNTLIVNINKKDKNIFTGVNYHTIRGEAYGLRAFLHFDLVRLYGASIATTGSTQPAIPYVDTIGTMPLPHLTTKAILERILKDLDIAVAALKDSDPIIPANAANQSVYLRSRFYKFNYYAAKALQARVYLYMGDKAKALSAAVEVINSNVFAWTPASEIATTNIENRNKLFTQEHVFALNISQFQTTVNGYFDVGTGSSLLAKDNSQYLALFQAVDYRYAHLTNSTPDNLRTYINKFIQTQGSSNRMPLIRKSELYYIAAECLAETDREQSIEYLNQVLTRRNASLLSTDASTDGLLAEIEKEYRREFIGEGQLFYYYKRKNASSIPDVPGVIMNNDIYVLPLPDREILYGY